MKTTNDANKHFNRFELIAPLLNSSEARVVFTALSLRSLSLILGTSNALYVTMIAIGAIGGWSYLLKAKEIVDQRTASSLEDFRHWKQLSSEPHAPAENQNTSEESSSSGSNSQKKLEDSKNVQTKSPGNIPKDLTDTRKVFMKTFGTESPCKELQPRAPVKKVTLNIQSDDGVLLGSDDVNQPVLMNE